MHSNLLLRKPTDSKLYVEDVFSTWLYTGNGSTQTITNGIDLAGKGGLVWIKGRTAVQHNLYDTARGARNVLQTATTGAAYTADPGTDLTAFNSNGFDLGPNYNAVNSSGVAFASWTFRKAPKFFDVVTYTGNGSTAGRAISHNLGSVPGLIIIKAVDAATDWAVYHRSLGATKYLNLNLTGAAVTAASYWNDTEPTDTTFTLKNNGAVNSNSTNYVAYLFAHDTTADGIVQCGSFTKDGSGNATVSLGWEPQYVLVKSTNGSNAAVGDSWLIADIMRGANYTATAWLEANASTAEGAYGGPWCVPTATGFQINGLSGGSNHIYLAIRRGPMRTPTDATKVYKAIARTGTGSAATVTGAGFSPDVVLPMTRSAANGSAFYDRLRGPYRWFSSNYTNAEAAYNSTVSSFDMDGFSVGTDVDSLSINVNSTTYINHLFRRAPGFFDVVCYTGTGSARTVSHNLGVAPELMIVKGRSLDPSAWRVYASSLGATKFLNLHTTGAATTQSDVWNNTSPTSSVFTVGTDNSVNSSGNTIVAYLFASCSGVSKVGSYTGTGATQTISCGFTGGARFVLIKRADGVASWWVWDTARGMVAGTDPRLALNFTNAEANANWVYTTTGGFQIVTSDTSINASGGTYIYLAIA